MSRIVGTVAILIALALGLSWYQHRAKMRALDSGEVFVRTQPGSNAKPVIPAPGKAAQPAATPEIATTSEAPPSSPQQSATPVSDTIARNPPNGLAFAGNGRYQLYRQGDITWRLNTDTGFACILLATDAQWSKTRVFQNGCNNLAHAAARGN